jgi:integrase
MPWVKTKNDAITYEFRKLAKDAGIYRPGLSFYAFRHTFATVAGETRDQVAVDAIMGHIRDDMASVYRERISDERLRAVSEYVRGWVFRTQGTEG